MTSPSLHLARFCLLTMLTLSLACKSEGSEASGDDAAPKMIQAGEPEELSGFMYLRLTDRLSLAKASVETPMSMGLVADAQGYYLPFYEILMVIEPGVEKPRMIDIPGGARLCGVHGDELIFQDQDRGVVLAVAKSDGQRRTIVAEGFGDPIYLVGDRIVMLASDSMLSHTPIAGGEVSTTMAKTGAEQIGDVGVRGDAILWAAYQKRGMILAARGKLDTVEVVHELTEADTRITDVAWLGDDVVYAIDQPKPTLFLQRGDKFEQLDVEIDVNLLMWSAGDAVVWMTHQNGAIGKAGRIDADSFHELKNPPSKLFPSPGGMTWTTELDGVTNYYVASSAPAGLSTLSLDLAGIQPLSHSLAKAYSGAEPNFEITLVDGTRKLHSKLTSTQPRMVAIRTDYCYKAALVREPGLMGTLVLDLEVGASDSLVHKVTKATVVGEFAHSELRDCIVEAVPDTILSLEDGGDAGTVRATIVMSPGS